MAMIVYGTKRYVSDRIVVYSFSPTPDDADVEGVVIADPADLQGRKIFPVGASQKHGEAALMKAYRHFKSTDEWPDNVSHIS